MPVSETEKRGVSSGCHFSDKAEHVPIKKRRFLLRSPSPPPAQTSPCAEESSNHTRSQDVSNKLVPQQSSSDIYLRQNANDHNSIGAKKSDKFNERFCQDEDFSGISILAAAACSSSLGRDCGYAEEGRGIEESSVLEQAREVSTNTETQALSKAPSKEYVINSSQMSCGATLSCISTEPLAEPVSISTTVNSSQKAATIGEGLNDYSSGVGSSSFACNVSCDKAKSTVRTQKSSSRDDRVHWDLNVVMDTWEQPFDDPSEQNDVAHNIFQDAGKSNHTDYIKLEGHDLQHNLETAYAEQHCLLSGEPRGLANQSSCEVKDKPPVEAVSSLKQSLFLGENSLPSISNLNFDVVKCMVEDNNCRRPEETAIGPEKLAVAAAQKSQPTSLCTIPEAADGASINTLNLNDNCDGYLPVMGALKSNVGMSSYRLQNLVTTDAVSADTSIGLCMSSNQDSLKQAKQSVAVPELQETPKLLHHEVDSHEDDVGKNTVEPFEHSKLALSDNNDFPERETPNFISERCELLVAIDTKFHNISNIQDDNIVGNIGALNNLSEMSALTPKGCCDSYDLKTCKNNLENCSTYSENIDHEKSFVHYNDGGERCLPALVDGMDAATELQADYDSQYEDGELRESGGRVWEEYDKLDREAEDPGDYHDRNIGRLVLDPAVSSHDSNIENEVHGIVSEAVDNERGLEEGNQINLSHVVEKKEPVLENQLCGSSKNYSDMPTTQGADDDDVKSRKPAQFDEYHNSESAETRPDPKTFRRGLQSQIEAPVTHDESYKEEQLKKMENRYEPGPIRSFERIRYPFHNRGRGRQGGSWDGSSDGRRSFRRHYSPIMHRNSKLDSDDVVERDDLERVGTQDDVSYSQQLFPNNRAIDEVDPYAGFHTRYKANRKFSPDRAGGFGRGRPFRYGPFGEGRGGRGGRGRFDGPSSDETFQTSQKYWHPLSRRERSMSPFGGRGQSNIHPSRRKSPSESRSRSPVWNSPRRRLGAGSGGNAFRGKRSRSPNFRSESRIQRLRSPHQQPGIGVDHTGGFRTISRYHGSPPRNRWNYGRKDEQGHFRELGYKQRVSALDRSPERIYFRSDRGSAMDYPRNPKPDGYYRFSDRAPNDSSRVRYDENFEERRKPYNLFRSARRNFDDGVPQETDDSFSIPNSFRDRDASTFQDRGLRSIDKRIGDGPRRFRGDNNSYNYERDGKFYPTSKQFGVDATDSSHNLKSVEQYRPNYNGRFSNVNGGNRGCRYENYEDRCKHYAPTNIMRRRDNDDTDKISNRDENVAGTSEFCGRVTRGFGGRIGSVATRFKEDENSVVGGQQGKLDGMS